MKKMMAGYLLFLSSFLLLFFNCIAFQNNQAQLYPLQSIINIPEPVMEQKKEFNRDTPSDLITVVKENGKSYTGYPSHNRLFLEKIITPLLINHLEKLSQLPMPDLINILALFSYEIYVKYLGKDFYRMAGDILDLDDPIEDHPNQKYWRASYAYGLDCSGFAAMPYDLAVYFHLLKPEQALFSSKGYAHYAIIHNIVDSGGLEGQSNHFRLDSGEFGKVGHLIFHLKKNQKPTTKQIHLLMPGDIVGLAGHVGIIVSIKEKLYYLEIAGWVVPKAKGHPVEARKALILFAKNRPISVWRCFMDRITN